MTDEVAFDRVLQALVDGGVKFVLAGGLALGSWGVVRGTKDVDIVAARDDANTQRLASVAFALGGQIQEAGSFVSSEFGIAAALAGEDRVFIETNLGPIDVLIGLPGVPTYEELLANSVEATLGEVEVRVCSLEDLRAMKRAAGRARDLADLEDLDAAWPPE